MCSFTPKLHYTVYMTVISYDSTDFKGKLGTNTEELQESNREMKLRKIFIVHTSFFQVQIKVLVAILHNRIVLFTTLNKR